ncbi:MAG: metallophosphatase family protein [Thermomicrobiales bacterium]|nr:metallophosphatase family protein [Thermomicrobiales bacterium]
MSILIVSDIHANLAALEAVLEAAGPVDTIWNLGDTVGYGPYPGECLDAMVDLEPDVMLLGNHDAASVGLLSLDEFNPIARAATMWTTSQLTDEQRNQVAFLPLRATVDGCLCVHGSPRQPIWEYLYSAEVSAANFEVFDEAACFLGHTHVQLWITNDMADAGIDPRLGSDGESIQLDQGRFIINPGSVGQPRDGNPDAAFALFDPDLGVVTFRRVPYDIARTQTAMRDAGLPMQLITRLAAGV